MGFAIADSSVRPVKVSQKARLSVWQLPSTPAIDRMPGRGLIWWQG